MGGGIARRAMAPWALPGWDEVDGRRRRRRRGVRWETGAGSRARGTQSKTGNWADAGMAKRIRYGRTPAETRGFFLFNLFYEYFKVNFFANFIFKYDFFYRTMIRDVEKLSCHATILSVAKPTT